MPCCARPPFFISPTSGRLSLPEMERGGNPVPSCTSTKSSVASSPIGCRANAQTTPRLSPMLAVLPTLSREMEFVLRLTLGKSWGQCPDVGRIEQASSELLKSSITLCSGWQQERTAKAGRKTDGLASMPIWRGHPVPSASDADRDSGTDTRTANKCWAERPQVGC